jgi:hypothetical protein
MIRVFVVAGFSNMFMKRNLRQFALPNESTVTSTSPKSVQFDDEVVLRCKVIVSNGDLVTHKTKKRLTTSVV